MRATEFDRFWSKVDVVPGQCWTWKRPLGAGGYGNFHRSDGRKVKAHRRAWELLVGPIPEGLELDHLCRVRHCVNPDHLEPVTHAENVRRGQALSTINARKTHCRYGHCDWALTCVGGRRCMECDRINSRLKYKPAIPRPRPPCGTTQGYIASETPTSPPATAAPVPDSPAPGSSPAGVESGTENATQGEPCDTNEPAASTATSSRGSSAAVGSASTPTSTSSPTTTSGETGTESASVSTPTATQASSSSPPVSPGTGEPTSPSPSNSTCASSASSDPIIGDPAYSDVQYAEVTEHADRLAQVAVGLPPVPPTPTGLNGLPFAPAGLTGCDEMSWYRAQAGLTFASTAAVVRHVKRSHLS